MGPHPRAEEEIALKMVLVRGIMVCFIRGDSADNRQRSIFVLGV
jgi:hypothetical protein